MRVLFLAAELAPFAKVGGLGDVAAALPSALSRLGVDVRATVPLYRSAKRALGDAPALATFPVRVGAEARTCEVVEGAIPGSEVPVYFLGHDPYFDRPGIYGEGGGGYPDELERFAFLSQAALDLCDNLGWSPDVIHAHDWHTALLPIYLRAGYRDNPIRSVLTLHNLAFQGAFSYERARALGLADPAWKLVRQDGSINLLLGGVRAADWLTTVSPSYAQEIQSPEGGMGLDEALRTRGDALTGILNGIDPVLWDPASDPHLWAPYSAEDLRGKADNKRALQATLGLLPDDAPVVGMVSRLAEQKGFDLVIEAFERMMALGVQLVVLGEGDPRYASFFREAEGRHPGRVRALIQFSEEWAHRVEAGSDIFLMPSRFEPAGLNQLYSLRYGAVPVVRATGGLRDTILECDTDRGSGNGFVFDAYTPDAMIEALGRALRLWRQDPQAWRALVRRGMQEDHSWGPSARQYQEIYERVLAQPPARSA